MVTQVTLFSGNLEQQGKKVNTNKFVETCRVADTPALKECVIKVMVVIVKVEVGAKQWVMDYEEG